MTRLLCFLSFFPASYVVGRTCEQDTLSWYLITYSAAYLGGKTADMLTSAKKSTIVASQAESINVDTGGGSVNVGKGGEVVTSQ